MALRAKALEYPLAGARVSEVVPQIIAHFGHHFFAFRIPLFTNRAEGFFHSPDRLAVIGFHDLSQMIRVQNTAGKPASQDGVQQFARPGLALHDEIDGERLEFRREFWILQKNDISEPGLFAAPESRKDPAGEIRRSR